MVHIIGDDASLQRAYRRSSESTAKFDREMKQTTRGAAAGSGLFKNMGRQIAFASGSFLGGAGIVAGLKASVDAASNLAEQQNKVNVVFGQSGRTINDWAKTTASSIGIANDQALEAAGTFGNLFRTVGLAPQRNAELSRSLVTLAADMASFNNADPSEVLMALRSGLIGEAEPLRRFGVLLSETRVQQEAMRETGKRTTKALTDQDKVLARYNLILQDTAPAQGDFANTSDGLANSQRTLTAEVRDLSAALGNGLKPAVEAVVRTLSDGIGAQDKHEDRTKKISLQSRLLGVSLRLSGSVLKQWKKDLEQEIGPVLTLAEALNKLTQAAEHIKPITITGVEEREPGRSPRGAAPFQPIVGAPVRPRASLAFQMSMLRERFAKAELTATQRDDRAALVLMQNLLHRQITATKDLKLRTQLYGDLGNVQDQITAIDDKAAADKQDALDKEKAAKEKELAAEKKRLEAHRAHIRQMRAAWAATLEKIRQATDAVRGEFGALPFQATPAGILGVQGQSTRSFVGAYVNQTRQFVGFYNNLNRLRKMGAPRGLVEQLRGQGAETGGIIARGLIAHPGQLRRLVRAFGERERVVQQIAHADIHARIVHLHMGGARPGATTAASRRGRNAGIPLTGT